MVGKPPHTKQFNYFLNTENQNYLFILDIADQRNVHLDWPETFSLGTTREQEFIQILLEF